MRTGFPCNESRFFPVGIDLQGYPVSYTGFGFAVHLHALLEPQRLLISEKPTTNTKTSVLICFLLYKRFDCGFKKI